MPEQIKMAIILGLATVVGLALAIMVTSPEEAVLHIRVAYHAIGFVIGFAPVALGGVWLTKRLGI